MFARLWYRYIDAIKRAFKDPPAPPEPHEQQTEWWREFEEAEKARQYRFIRRKDPSRTKD